MTSPMEILRRTLVGNYFKATRLNGKEDFVICQGIKLKQWKWEQNNIYDLYLIEKKSINLLHNFIRVKEFYDKEQSDIIRSLYFE